MDFKLLSRKLLIIGPFMYEVSDFNLLSWKLVIGNFYLGIN